MFERIPHLEQIVENQSPRLLGVNKDHNNFRSVNTSDGCITSLRRARELRIEEKKKECYCVVNDCIGSILAFCEKTDSEFGVEDGKCSTQLFQVEH